MNQILKNLKDNMLSISKEAYYFSKRKPKVVKEDEIYKVFESSYKVENEKFYEISNFGNIRNYKTKKQRRTYINNSGYVCIILYKNGEQVWKKIGVPTVNEIVIASAKK